MFCGNIDAVGNKEEDLQEGASFKIELSQVSVGLVVGERGKFLGGDIEGSSGGIELKGLAERKPCGFVSNRVINDEDGTILFSYKRIALIGFPHFEF